MKSNTKTVFISAPVSLKWSTVCDFDEAISEKSKVPVEIKAWDRKQEYIAENLDKSDAVIFLLPNNDFECTYIEMPTGLRMELARAYALNKPIFVGYKTRSTGDYNIYSAETDGKSIEGIAGTAGSIYDTVLVSEPKKNVADIEDISGSMWTGNPCAEIELPKAKRVYATTIPNPDYRDERLNLLL